MMSSDIRQYDISVLVRFLLAAVKIIFENLDCKRENKLYCADSRKLVNKERPFGTGELSFSFF